MKIHDYAMPGGRGPSESFPRGNLPEEFYLAPFIKTRYIQVAGSSVIFFSLGNLINVDIA